MPKRITHADVVKGIMSPDAHYYVGRGNMHVDLNSNKLERIWEQVVDKVHTAAGDGRAGVAAGENFVKMVKALTEKGDVSATTFLNALSDLAYNNWQYQGSVPSTESAIVSAIEGSDHANWGEHDAIMKDALKDIVAAGKSPLATTAKDIAGEFLQKHAPATTPTYKTPTDAQIGSIKNEHIRRLLERGRKSDDPPPSRGIG